MYRQTKHWFQEPDKIKSYDLIQLDRQTLGQCMQWLTGHTRMNRHQHLIDVSANKNKNDDDQMEVTTPTCRLCNRGEETPYHLVMDCDAMCDDSNITFGKQEIPPDPEKFQFRWKVDKLVGFLQIPDLQPLLGLGEPDDENQVESDDAMDVDQNHDDENGIHENQDESITLEEIYDVRLHPSEY